MAETVPVKKTCLTSFLAIFKRSRPLRVDENELPTPIQRVLDRIANLAFAPMASVASVPVASVPVASVPVASVPVASVPVASVPVASVAFSNDRVAVDSDPVPVIARSDSIASKDAFLRNLTASMRSLTNHKTTHRSCLYCNTRCSCPLCVLSKPATQVSQIPSLTVRAPEPAP